MRAMKDSGIEWIGEIPQDWNVKKLKYCVELRLEKTNDLASAVPYIGLEHVSSFTGTLSDAYEPITAFNGDTLDFYSGDVLFGKLRPYLAKAYQADCNGRCSSEFWVMNPQNIEGRYLLYYVLSHGFISNVDHSTFGVKMPRAEWDFAGNERIPVPSRQEQIRIADYLDSKCAEIDALIAAKEKTNALLKEQRQSLIYEAVTKGLDPNAPMKDSGVEWIGDIPAGWSTIRAKYATEITNGCDPKTEGEIPVYGSGSDSFRTCGEYKEGPAVLIGRKGATLHIPHYVEGRYWNVDTAFDVKTDEAKMLLKYYYFAAICFDYKLYISTTTLPGMTQTNYGNMFLPYPSIEEQTAIIQHIEVQIERLENAISTNEKMIKKLKQFRQSVIYEAVTGKIEV